MKIVLYGNPTLRVKSAEVDKVDDDLRKTLDEMVELMRSANGVGLAANQVDIPKRFFVLEVEGNVKKVVNPEIIESGEEMVEFEEGCLSIPGVYKKVTRPEKIKVKYLDENGEEKIEELRLRQEILKEEQEEMEQVEVLKEYRSMDISLDEFLEMMRNYKKERQNKKKMKEPEEPQEEEENREKIMEDTNEGN